MTSKGQLRKAVSGLPEVEEGSHLGMVSFSVRGKGFASLTEGGVVQVRLTDDAEAFLAKVPGERLARAANRSDRRAAGGDQRHGPQRADPAGLALPRGPKAVRVLGETLRERGLR